MSSGPKSETVVLADRQQLDREAGRLPPLADRVRAREQLVAGRPWLQETREVALDVRDEGRDARGGEPLGHELERAGLAGSGGARDERVPVEGGQREPEVDAGHRLPVLEQHADREQGALGGIAGADRGRELGQIGLRHGRRGSHTRPDGGRGLRGRRRLGGGRPGLGRGLRLSRLGRLGLGVCRRVGVGGRFGFRIGRFRRSLPGARGGHGRVEGGLGCRGPGLRGVRGGTGRLRLESGDLGL
jgi:hypothetical protein